MIYMPREIANRPCTFTRSIYLWIVHIESKGYICHIFFKLKKKIQFDASNCLQCLHPSSFTCS